MKLLRKLRLVLTISCEQASQLTSESFERSLGWHENAALRGHTLVCWSCRQFEKQLKFIRLAMQTSAQRETQEVESGPVLPNATKDKLKSLRVSDAE